MQKFFGFDSTIGVGRNFGFKAGEAIALPPLEKPVITSIDEGIDMAGGIRLEFAQFGDFDSFTIYRSDAPIDIASLPAPIATGVPTMYYVDNSVVIGNSYYYRVGVARGSEMLLSDESMITVKDPSALNSGYLLVIYSGYGTGYDNPELDVSNIEHPNWTENFSKTTDIGLFDYRHSNSGANKRIDRKEKIINDFSVNWQLELLVYGTATSTERGLSLEILDINNNVLFAMRTAISGSYVNDVYYGTSLSSTQKIKQVSNQMAWGLVTFTEASVNFQNYYTDAPDAQFNYSVDLISAVKVRVGGSADRHFNGDFSRSGGYIKLLP